MKRFFLAVTCILVGLLGTSPWQATAEDSCASGDKSKEPKAGTEKYVRHALSRSVSVDVTDRPLNEVVNDLARQAKVPVEFHHGSLDAVGLDPDALPNVTAKLHELPLRSCLRILLRESELTYMVDEGVLMIATPEEAESERHEVIAVLDVSDLLGVEEGASLDIELITTTVMPTSWFTYSGPSPIESFRGTLVFRQTDEYVHQTCQLLAAIRKAKQITAEHGNSPPPVTSIPAERNQRIRKRTETALDSKADLELKDVPLNEAVTRLRKKYEIPIRIRKPALDALGLNAKAKVTFRASSGSFRSALRRGLDALELTYLIYESVLIITTQEDAEQNLTMRVYPVRDLVEPIPHSSLPWAYAVDSDDAYLDYDSLVALTTQNIAPTSWDEVGGPGSVSAFSAYGLMVISQTEVIHQEIEEFYTRLRKTIPAAAKKPLEHPDDDELRTAVYLVPGNPWGVKGKEHEHINPSEREVLNLITSIVEPESWRERNDVYAHAIKERLIIRHTNAVHREIRELARKLEIWGFRETGVYKSNVVCGSITPIVGDKTLRSPEPVQPKQKIKR